jgi:glutaredoxin
MWFGKLFRWIGRPPALDHLHVIMYTRAGCQLCVSAWEELSRAQRRFGFRLQVIDIDTDPQLMAQHGESVPVVTVNGKVRFRGEVNRVLLERLLQSEAEGMNEKRTMKNEQ